MVEHLPSVQEALGSISSSTKAKQSRKLNKTWLNDPLYLAPQEKGVWPGDKVWVRFEVENDHSNSVLVVFPYLLLKGPVSPLEDSYLQTQVLVPPWGGVG